MPTSEDGNFSLCVSATPKNKEGNQIFFHLTFSYLPSSKAAGTAIIEVELPPGMIPNNESIEELYQDVGLNLKRVDVVDNTAIFYVAEIGNAQKSLTFILDEVFSVENRQSATVRIYDYYNQGESKSISYTI